MKKQLRKVIVNASFSTCVIRRYMKKPIRNFKIPHLLIFLSAIILFSSALTYLVPSGVFERNTRMIGNIDQNVVIPGSYKKLPKHYSITS